MIYILFGAVVALIVLTFALGIALSNNVNKSVENREAILKGNKAAKIHNEQIRLLTESIKDLNQRINDAL